MSIGTLRLLTSVQGVTSSSTSSSNHRDGGASGSINDDGNSSRDSDGASAAPPSPRSAVPAKGQHGKASLAQGKGTKLSSQGAADSKPISGRKRLRKAC